MNANIKFTSQVCLAILIMTPFCKVTNIIPEQKNPARVLAKRRKNGGLK